MNATSSTGLMQALFDVGIHDIETLIAEAKPGSEGVRVCPFWSGERIPPLPRARASMRGLSYDNFTRPNLMRAAAEAVAFVLKFGYRKIPRGPGEREPLRLTGGGANSPSWRQIIADVFETDAIRVKWDEGGAFGATLLALSVHRRALGGGRRSPRFATATWNLTRPKRRIRTPRNVALYRDVFGEFIETLRREYGVEA